MGRTSRILLTFGSLLLCLSVIVWLSVHSLDHWSSPRNRPLALKPFATRPVEFSGIKEAMVRLDGRMISTRYRVYHAPPDKWRIEYLVPVEARGRVMIRDGDSTWQLEPSEKRIFVTSGDVGIENYEEVDSLLLTNYTLKPVFAAVQAGRKCEIMQLIPKHPGKSSWRIWVDNQIGNILRRERYASDGKVDMASQFTEFKPGRVDPGLFDNRRLPNYEVVNRTWGIKMLGEGETFRLAGIKPPRTLPGGFHLRSACQVSGHPGSVQLTYSDGFCAVSLFAYAGRTYGQPISKDARHTAIGRVPAHVETYGYLTSLYWQSGDHNYTLIADIGEPVMIDMAKSLL